MNVERNGIETILSFCVFKAIQQMTAGVKYNAFVCKEMRGKINKVCSKDRDRYFSDDDYDDDGLQKQKYYPIKLIWRDRTT